MKNESLNLLSVTKCVPGCVNEADISGFISCLGMPHSKQSWVVLTQIWVKYGQTQIVGLKM